MGPASFAGMISGGSGLLQKRPAALLPWSSGPTAGWIGGVGGPSFHLLQLCHENLVIQIFLEGGIGHGVGKLLVSQNLGFVFIGQS
jgi:hypothetical protein